MKYLNAAFIFILFSIASFGGGIAQKLAKAAGENSNIEIAFSQRKTMSLFDEVMESKMVFVTDSKGRMRWQVLEPYQSVTIFDGRQVHQFELEAGGWKKLDFSETTLQMEFESSGKAEVCIKVNEDLCQAKEMSGIETDIKFAFQITRNRPYIVTLS